MSTEEVERLSIGLGTVQLESQYAFQILFKKKLCTLSSTKEARIYNRKKTTSLTSGAGKTGQPLVKE